MSDFDHYEPTAADRAEAGVLDIGDIFGTTARAVAANFLQFSVIAFVCLLPAMVLGFFYNLAIRDWTEDMIANPAFGYGGELLPAWFIPGTLAVVFLQVVLSQIAQAAMLYGAVEFMAGRSAPVGAALVTGVRRSPAIIVISILSGLAITFGLFLCVVPGVIVLCMLYLAVPVAVMEDCGPIDALQRSVEMTAGHRVTIFLALLVVGIAFATMNCMVGLAGGGLGAGAGQLPSMGMFLFDFIISQVFALGQAVVIATLSAVIYARIRGVRDGVDANALAQVFA